MNSQLTTLEPVTTAANAKVLLTKDGFTCTLLMLAPGDEAPGREASQAEEHLLYLIEGEATVRFDDINTMLSKDEVLLIPKGRRHTIAAHPGGWAKLLRVDVPPRRVVVPQIISFDR